MNKFIIAGLITIVGVAGCATRSSVEEVKQIALEAQRKADAAAQCCVATDAKLDAMFKKSMMK
jgi:hypothetical protein